MKKFIKKIFVLIIPIVLTSHILDFFISNNLKKSNTYAHKEFSTWNAIVDGKLDAEILIYGSSRAWVQFDSQILEDTLKLNTYNLGIDGHSFIMQLLRHKLALEHNSKPKMIIHSVDIGTLEKGRLYNSDQFLPYMLWNQIFYDHMSLLKGYSYFDYNIPLVRYYGRFEAIKEALKMSLNQSNPIQRVKGYMGSDATWNNDFDNAKKLMNEYVVTPDSYILSLFDNYLKECKNKNIQVVLVYAPYYTEGQIFIKNQQEIINMYRALATEYDFTFFDFTKDEICSDKNYFYNASHMNRTGAEVFTRKLAHKLKARTHNNVYKK